MYEAIMFWLGWAWFTLMLCRLPVVAFDVRTFYRAFAARQYTGNKAWIVFTRVFLPNLLSAPVCAWMGPRDYFTRTSALDAFEIAGHLADLYGPEVAEEEDEHVDLNQFVARPSNFKQPGDSN